MLSWTSRKLQGARPPRTNPEYELFQKPCFRKTLQNAGLTDSKTGPVGRSECAALRKSSLPVVDLAKHKIVCHSELGGHLKSYRTAA
ncbi:MAG TPA: hypothetical protein DDZ51_01850 [Planctomycetaceae bacterium]|nr:hypothetical protein [Planctomycetaceae bacterium]